MQPSSPKPGLHGGARRGLQLLLPETVAPWFSQAGGGRTGASQLLSFSSSQWTNRNTFQDLGLHGEKKNDKEATASASLPY